MMILLNTIVYFIIQIAAMATVLNCKMKQNHGKQMIHQLNMFTMGMQSIWSWILAEYCINNLREPLVNIW